MGLMHLFERVLLGAPRISPLFQFCPSHGMLMEEASTIRSYRSKTRTVTFKLLVQHSNQLSFSQLCYAINNIVIHNTQISDIYLMRM